YIDDKGDFYFPLPKDELQKIAVARLRDYISSRTDFDVRVFNNFYYNCWKEKDRQNHVILLEDANKLVGDYIEKFPEGYLRFTIRSKNIPHLDEEYVFETFTYQYIGSWEKFKQFLNKTVKGNKEFSNIVEYFDNFEKAIYDIFRSESIPKWVEMD